MVTDWISAFAGMTGASKGILFQITAYRNPILVFPPVQLVINWNQERLRKPTYSMKWMRC